MDPDAREEAKKLDIQIFEANIIYHLFDMFLKYMDEWKERQKAEAKKLAIFPCILKIDPLCVFHRSEPIIVGVTIEKGVLHVGTVLCVKVTDDKKHTEILTLGTVTSIEKDKKSKDSIREGEFAIKIEPRGQSHTFGRQFNHEHQLVSKLTRESIDALKSYFRDEPHMTKDDWKLVVQLKKYLNIM